jgi:arylsulfatase A-like enzyme
VDDWRLIGVTRMDAFPRHRPIRPPQGAPNVLLVLLDDMGFGASSAFGGPIAMPATERLSAGGLRYTRFHTTGVCSPTRAALLTGRNHHSVGMGTLPDLATSAPGYNSVRPGSAATLAQILKLNGYSTAAFGKWHQTPAWEVSPSGPFDRWPTGEGFERFYGFNSGETNQYYPGLFDCTTAIDPPRRPEEGYHLSEDLVDQAIAWIAQVNAGTPDKPFFCYLPLGATHAPLHVRREWIDPYRDSFGHGWNRQRELTLARQIELGIVPPDATLAPWASELPLWQDISPAEQETACWLMELYAGFAAHTDAQIGRLVDFLEAAGLFADTLIIYILGDNGASAEGGLTGTLNEFTTINGFVDDAERILAAGDALGGPATYPHYPAGWALAMDAPYQWTKQVASHYGGTRNGMVVHWPNGIQGRGELRHQWHHCVDITPTILEAAGIVAPRSVNGIDQQPIEGASLVYTFSDETAADRHCTQYFEIFGNRGIYHQGWVACTKHRTPWLMMESGAPDFADDVWELYDTDADWTQARNLAADHPEKLAELQELFLIEAARHQVLPLDDRFAELFLPEIAGRPSLTMGRSSVTYPPGTRDLPQDVVPNVRNRSHTVVADVHVDAAGTGVVVSQGGAFGGWSLYLLDGCLTYCHNVVGMWIQYVRAAEPIERGHHEIGFSLDYDGGGFGKGGLVTLRCDGAEVASGRVERTTPFAFSVADKFHVGVNRGTPVTDDYPALDNNFCGDVAWVRIDTGDDATHESPERIAQTAMAFD